ncbi:MAG: M20/M25/M40 family metallo-hydrolase [Actinobacteria bacterium]|nr:M20/M25/M40 family metallo-hydrolase [Actinomycetota bacterium]
MLKDLQTLVECESPSSDLAACEKVLEVANQITTRVIGASAEIIQESGRPVYWLGSKNPEVVLLTHLDTVWPIGSFSPLWRVDGDIASGPGVFDMKSGFIQALYAMRGQDINRVALIATTDEETGSATSRKLIEEVSKKAKAVLVMEASLDGKLKIGRKGTSMYQITIHGRAAHAGLEPEKGINATVEISKIVGKLIALENRELGTSVVPTVMTSGSTTNTVPALASLDVDSRSFTMAEMKRVEQAIRALKPENVKLFDLKWTSSNAFGNFLALYKFTLPILFQNRNVVIFSFMTETHSMALAPVTRMLGIKHILWYAHVSSPIRVRVSRTFKKSSSSTRTTSTNLDRSTMSFS